MGQVVSLRGVIIAVVVVLVVFALLVGVLGIVHLGGTSSPVSVPTTR